MTKLDEAWTTYLEDVETMRQMFLNEPIVKDNPKQQASAINLVHQTAALSYNLIVAPRADHPVFLLQHFVEPFIYPGHLPCPDFAYRLLIVNGKRQWRVFGKRNSSHWTDIQVSPGFWGHPKFKVLGNYDFDKDFHIEPDGSFEIFMGPGKSPGHRNWIELEPDVEECSLLIRQAHYRWGKEVSIEFNIEPADDTPPRSIVLDEDEMIRRLDLAGKFCTYTTKMWQGPTSRRVLKYVGLNEFIVRYGDKTRGSNPLAQYGQCIFELKPDEALIIEAPVPNAPYWSVHMGNYWWETLDFTRHKSSINGAQAVIDSDGKFRAVVAHQDPGVPNWLDTIGWDTGLALMRWYRADSELTLTTKVVKFAELSQHLPADTPRVTQAERKDELSRRHYGTLRRLGY